MTSFFGRGNFWRCGALLLLLAPGWTKADNAIVPTAGGTSLFGDEVESKLSLSGAEFGEKRLVPAEGVPFAQAVELRTWRRPPAAWNFQVATRVPGAVHKGDVLWVSIWMRATQTSAKTAEGFSQISIEKSSAPYNWVGSFDLVAGARWKQFAQSFVADRDYPAGGTQLCVRGGYAPQTIQVGGVQLLDYGTAVAAESLPRTKITYLGMEPDAPWRAAAAARIEQYRKGNLRVTVTDASGAPVNGASVRMEELHSAFGFGSAVAARMIEATGPDSDHYREIVRNDYSKVVIENALKWIPSEHDAAEGHKTTLAAMHWLLDQGLTIRGHNLVWPSWQNSPRSLAAFKSDPGALEAHIEDHILDEVTATQGMVTEWDVVNEPFMNHDLLDLLGPDAMASWFRLVHGIDPKPVLFLNENAGLINWGDDSASKDAFEKTLRSLQAQGAPIGGLGIQAHFGLALTGPEQVVRELDRWAALGLDIQITEFDIAISDEKVQGQYMRDFMTAVFSHPAVSACLIWGFWAGNDWIPEAALYRKDWSIKPNGEAWNDLVLKEWHTDRTMTTDPSGNVATRGFLGTYRITVTYGGKSQTWPLTLPKEGAVLSATLPAN